jgi:hypothetical protein
VEGLPTADGKAYFAVVQRPDGLYTFEIQDIGFDEDTDSYYWRSYSNAFGGVFETANGARAWIMSLPRWGEAGFDWWPFVQK